MTGLPSALRRGPLSGRDAASGGASPLLGESLAVVLVALAGAAAAWLAFAAAPRVFFQLGPNETPYLHGFRPGGWEREGTTRFHWTTMSSLVRLPVRVSGEGVVLRARVRRHMVEPAQVTLRVEGRAVQTLSIQADTKIDYKIIEIRLPRLEGHHEFVLGFESSSRDSRPLGLAIDWLELERGTGRFRPLSALAALLAFLAIVTYAAPRLSGLPRGASLLLAASLILAAAAGAADVIALDRIARDGAAAYAFTALATLAAVALLRRRGISHEVAGVLAVLVMAGIGLRLVLLLHPRFFYPDMVNHGHAAYVLSKEGALTFLERFFETQFRFNLGVQFQAGHWYAFPYAPGLYFLSWPLITLAALRPEVAVASVAAVFNSLGLLVTFVLARFLLRSDRLALLAGVAHLALPLYMIRLTMAYFPSVTGHAVDSAALTFLLLHLVAPPRLRLWIVLAVLLTLSLLLYPQALVNFAMLFGAYLAWDVLKARTSEDRRRQVSLAVAVTVALTAATAFFYHRYVPVFLDMRHGTPMPEEEIRLDKQRVEREYAAARGETLVPYEEADPYSGPSFNPARGLWRVIARLFIFHGPWLLSVVWGLYLLIVAREGTERRFLLAWASLFFAVCFLAGALPAPNFLRYAKDLEASTPLFCAAFALATGVMARRSRTLAIVHIAAFVVMGLARGLEMWLSTFEPR